MVMFSCCFCEPPPVVFCKGHRVGTNEPCGSWDIDASGYCKFHSTKSPQCRAIAAKTGQRCLIRWYLDDEQLCKYHGPNKDTIEVVCDKEDKSTNGVESGREVDTLPACESSDKIQSASGKVPLDEHFCMDSDTRTTQETSDGERSDEEEENDYGEPEEDVSDNADHDLLYVPDDYDPADWISDNLDGESADCEDYGHSDYYYDDYDFDDSECGYDSYLWSANKRRRTGEYLQCRGDAATTGKRCSIRWDLDDRQLCKFHSRQIVKCHGVIEGTGQRCRSSENVDKYGFCPLHGRSGKGSCAQENDEESAVKKEGRC